MRPVDPSPPSVEALLRQVREQKQGAWEQLLRRYKLQLDDWAASYIRRSAPGGIRASDVSQEAALTALERFSSFQGSAEGEWHVWLQRIVESQWADMCRHATRQKRDAGGTLSLDADEVQDLPALQHTPSQVAAQQERGRLLLRHFLELPKEQREALSPYLLRGSSREALMARSGRSWDALESLLRRGMRTLAARMEGREEVQPQEPHEALLNNQVDAALAVYFRRLEEGVPVEPETFAMDYPECADALLGLLRWLEALRALQPED